MPSSSSRNSTRGRLMPSSKPSRRIVSISTPSWSSPRPATSKLSLSAALGDLDRDIAFGFAEQAVADHAAGDLVAFAAGHRAIVDGEAHRQRRRVDRLGVERLGHRGVGDGVGDGRGGEAGDRDDVAGAGLVDRHALEPAEGHQLGRAAGLDDLAVGVERVDRRVDLDRARETRPVRMRPRKLSRSSKVTRNLNGPSGSAEGGGTWLTIVSNKRRQVPSRASRLVAGIAVAAEA